MPEEENLLASLHKQRGAIKAKLTKFQTFVEGLANRPYNELTKEELVQLETRVEIANSWPNAIDHLQEQIFQLSISQGSDEEAWSSEFDEVYFAELSKAKIIINSSNENTEEGTESRSPLPSVVGSCCSNAHGNNSRLKLPTVSLPKFDGRYTGWMEFRDVFQSMIHDNVELPDVQKFHYLKASLEKEAAEILRNMAVSSDNYAIAWKLLCDRYTNKRLLIQNHIRALFQLKEISKESAVQLRDHMNSAMQHLRSLEALGQPTQHWDSFIVYLISSKFDRVTARDWEQCKTAEELPTVEDLTKFVSKRAAVLDNLGAYKTPTQGLKPQRTFISSTLSCYLCKGSHALYNCEQFLKLSAQERAENVKRMKLCSNCLKISHSVENCHTRARGCRKCKQPHNTLLHFEGNQEKATTMSTQVVVSRPILLSTAVIYIKDIHGEFQTCRTLLDSCAQSHFITAGLVSRLGLKQDKVRIAVSGINPGTSLYQSKCDVTIKSRVSSFQESISCIVTESISEPQPSALLDLSMLKIPENLQMADPDFEVSSEVDMLFGSEFFWSLLSQGKVSLGPNLPTIQNTLLGWIVGGALPVSTRSSSFHCFLSNTLDLQFQLQKFWELEECPTVPALSIEQRQAEAFFTETLLRSKEGRYQVKIPFKDNVSELGESYSTAFRRFHLLERRLSRNQELKVAYSRFMAEYESLGHMERIFSSDDNSPHYYLPHHGVINTASSTTKLRVVFDGSCPSASGLSLNDVQMAGPTVQDQLFHILLRFRQHSIAFAGDVRMMYRQVEVHPTQRCFQKILWRADPSLPLCTFQLRTVTYGTKSAPFLATRCLVQVALDNKHEFPEACELIRSDMYVDDLLSGAETLDQSKDLCRQVRQILQSINFPLHKWVSNNQDLMKHLNVDSSPTTMIEIGPNECTKTLGLYWLPSSDNLRFKISEMTSQPVSKRSLLSDISQVFDPIGLVSPTTIIGKMILQRLWQSGVGWDDELPVQLAEQWSSFRQDLPSLNQLQVPRHASCKSPVRTELHCFADASSLAYAACVYLKSIDRDGISTTELLTAKTKVAPLKQITIPRLELCAAKLAAQLMTQVKSALRRPIDRVCMWSDFTIVLGWSKTSPSDLKVFVSHRVFDIQTMCQDAHWFHVRTADNPADLGSRGILASDLLNSSIWWHGPSWLSQDESQWSTVTDTLDFASLPEIKHTEMTLVSSVIECPVQFSRFSQWSRLVRAVAYCYKFLRISKPSDSITLSSLDILKSETFIFKIIQSEVWNSEIQMLKFGEQVHKTSNLSSLAPFLDKDDGLLRVGGRLQASDQSRGRKHPILLPKHYVTRLLFEHQHRRLAHAGPNQLFYSLRERYWPLNGRNYARLVVHKCVQCFKCRPVNATPYMGSLPAERVNIAAPFQLVGVDYAGPFSVKDRQGRGCRVTKCYVALFICTVTKAIHLELVSSLSTEAFLASLRRFVSRRGRPTRIFSDNGSNFVGADSELRKLVNHLRTDQARLEETLTTDGISWSFIPPHAPNFGGLWEAGVKGMKFHLRRVVGNAYLTFEQFNTLLCQVEAIMNSRPLCPMSSNPNDLESLTPSHFLIGRSLTAIPEREVLHLPTNRLAEFERIQQLTQHLWVRWKDEYLGTLQPRGRWTQHHPNLSVGTMVLLKEDNTPSLHWPLGRIVEVFPGQDNTVRVVSVLTKKGTYKRPVSKVFPLPHSVVSVNSQSSNTDN